MSDADDALAAELYALGRSLRTTPPADDLVEQVLRRLGDGRAPIWRRARRRARRRLVAVVMALVLLGLALTPPVRAAVVEWLRLGGLVVRTAPPLDPTVTPDPPPTAGGAVSLETARSLVAFPVGVPADLGPPDRVSVSGDRRVVAMDWGTGARRLHVDQFDGGLSWVFLKRTGHPLDFAAVNGRDAIWFADPHELVYVDRDGLERTEQARISGPSLVWEQPSSRGPVTVRLEGQQLSKTRAVEIAQSMG